MNSGEQNLEGVIMSNKSSVKGGVAQNNSITEIRNT